MRTPVSTIAIGLLTVACGPSRDDPPEVPVEVDARTTMDLNGDGYADVALTRLEQVLIYYGSPDGLDLAAPTEDSVPDQGPFLAFVGDLTGDGTSELYRGSSWTDADRSGHIYTGSTLGDGRVLQGTIPLVPEFEDVYLPNNGSSTRRVGDLDGDGLDDLVIVYPSLGLAVFHGEPWDDQDRELTATMVWELGITPPPPVVGYDEPVGYSGVAPLGDADGDGLADVVVSYAWNDDENRLDWHSYTASGTSSGLSELQRDEFAGTLDGPSVHPGTLRDRTDLNGDGFGDLVVNEPQYLVEMHVYWGTASGLDQADPEIFEVQERPETPKGFAQADLLKSAAPAGDVNGDGYADLVAAQGGASLLMEDQGLFQAGFHVFCGSPDGISATPTWSVPPPSSLLGTPAEASFGMTARGIGDVNGDGFSDIAVLGGVWYVYFGSAVGPAEEPDQVLMDMPHNPILAAGAGGP